LTRDDYYQVLGLGPKASRPEIKSAFRRMALQYHPDRNKDPKAIEKFLLVVQAYEVLYEGKEPVTRDLEASDSSEEDRLRKAREVARAVQRERMEIERAFYQRIQKGYMLKYAHFLSFAFILMAILITLNYFLPYSEQPSSIQSKNMLYFYHLKEERAFFNVCNKSYRVPMTAFFEANRGDSVTVDVSALFNDVMRVRYYSEGREYTLKPHESVYTYFPLIPLMMLIPFLNLLFMKPNVRFYLLFFTSVFIGTAFMLYLFLDDGRIYRILDGFPC
jgi:hypothetical protein